MAQRNSITEVDVSAFEAAVAGVDGEASLMLAKHRVCGIGPLRRIFTPRASHVRTANAFLDALKTEFGDAIANMAVGKLRDQFKVGSPLTARKVRGIVSEVKGFNEALATFAAGWDPKSGVVCEHSLDRALADWFTAHPAGDALTPHALNRLKQQIIAQLRAGEPLCHSVGDMFRAVKKGAVSPMREVERQVAAALSSADLWREIAQDMPFDLVDYVADALLEEARALLREEIRARASVSTCGFTCLPKEAALTQCLQAQGRAAMTEYLSGLRSLELAALHLSRAERHALLFLRRDGLLRLATPTELAAAIERCRQPLPGDGFSDRKIPGGPFFSQLRHALAAVGLTVRMHAPGHPGAPASIVADGKTLDGELSQALLDRLATRTTAIPAWAAGLATALRLPATLGAFWVERALTLLPPVNAAYVEAMTSRVIERDVLLPLLAATDVVALQEAAVRLIVRAADAWTALPGTARAVASADYAAYLADTVKTAVIVGLSRPETLRLRRQLTRRPGWIPDFLAGSRGDADADDCLPTVLMALQQAASWRQEEEGFDFGSVENAEAVAA